MKKLIYQFHRFEYEVPERGRFTRKATVAAVQMDCEPMNTKGNMETALSLIRVAKNRGAELVVLPHMFATGYNTFLHPSRVAEDLSGSTMTFLRTVSQKLKIALLGGFIEDCGGKFYDTTVVMDGRGSIVGSYRRMSLWQDEEDDLLRGDDLCIVDLPMGRGGLMVSRDVTIPEIARTLTFEGAENLLVSAAIEDHAGWSVFARARAMENGCYVIASNRIGIEGELSYCGHSMIIDPNGLTLADCESRQEVAIAELDPKVIAQARGEDWQLVELEESFDLEQGGYLSEPMTCKTRVSHGKKRASRKKQRR